MQMKMQKEKSYIMDLLSENHRGTEERVITSLMICMRVCTWSLSSMCIPVGPCLYT